MPCSRKVIKFVFLFYYKDATVERLDTSTEMNICNVWIPQDCGNFKSQDASYCDIDIIVRSSK